MAVVKTVFSSFQIMLAVAVSFVVIALGSYIGAYAFTKRTVVLSSNITPPQVTNTAGVPQTDFHAGDGFIIQRYIERAPIKCWALYVDVIRGPINYQFPENRTQTISNIPVKVHIPTYHEFPQHIPVGKYTLRQLVFPTCDGIDVLPYSSDFNITINIIP